MKQCQIGGAATPGTADTVSDDPRVSNALIITGMHRSGTSLLANLLAHAGVDVGERLVGATQHNREGHFEDEDFVEFHDAVLADNGTSMYLENCPPRLKMSAENAARARELVAARAGRTLWGWKDPRTTLFLDFWRDSLPDARFLFIFRPAAEVVDSLARRNDPALRYRFRGAWVLSKLGLRMFKRSRAIEMWLAYNRTLLEFVRVNRQCCQLIDLDRLTDVFPKLIALLRDEWGMNVANVNLDELLKRDLLGKSPDPAIVASCQRRHDVQAVYDQLRELSLKP